MKTILSIIVVIILSTPINVMADVTTTNTIQPSTLAGAQLYVNHCGSCHGSLSITTKRDRSFLTIAMAIMSDQGGMGSITLRSSQINLIVDALSTATPIPVPPPRVIPTPIPTSTPSPTATTTPTPIPVVILVPIPTPISVVLPIPEPAVTPSPIPVSLPIPTLTLVETWDANHDGIIQKSEALSAVRAYFFNVISKDDALEIVTAYFKPR